MSALLTDSMDAPETVWKLIPGTNFEASSRGEIRSLKTGRVRRVSTDPREWTTQRENLQHAARQGRIVYQGDGNPHAVLTEALVVECRRVYAEGIATFDELAKRYGVSKSGLRNAVKGYTWRHVPGAATSDFRSTRSGWRR